MRPTNIKGWFFVTPAHGHFRERSFRGRPRWTKSKWRLIDGGEDVVRVALFGHPLMRRNWTWMCDVYARQVKACERVFAGAAGSGVPKW